MLSDRFAFLVGCVALLNIGDGPGLGQRGSFARGKKGSLPLFLQEPDQCVQRRCEEILAAQVRDNPLLDFVPIAE